MKSGFLKSGAADVARSFLSAAVITVLGVAAFAAAAKFAGADESVIVPVNIAIKIIAVAAGCIIGIRHKRSGLVKGLAAGLLYAGTLFLLCRLVNGNFQDVPMTLYDAAAAAIAGALSGILAVNTGRKAEA